MSHLPLHPGQAGRLKGKSTQVNREGQQSPRLLRALTQSHKHLIKTQVVTQVENNQNHGFSQLAGEA